MAKSIRYGVIGGGMMGQEHLRNIALLPDTEVAAIYEPNAHMAAAAQSLAPRAVLASSIPELLKVDTLDCVVIASPNQHHVGHIELVARTRRLPVLVEKPLFIDLAEFEQLERLDEVDRGQIWVAMEYRYMPPIAAFVEAVEAATGGVKMLAIREHRYPFLDKVKAWNRFNNQSGGTFVEKCCHFFDLMRLILKSEPVRVMASGGQDVNHRAELVNGAQPDILDNGFAIVDFECGARAALDLCMFAEGSEYQEELSAVGPDGKIEALVPGPTRFWPDELGPPPVPRLVVSPRSPKRPEMKDVPVDSAALDAGDHNGSTFYQHQSFLEFVRGGRPSPAVSFDDGKQAVIMGLAVQRSIAERRSVEIAELQSRRPIALGTMR